MDNKLTFRPFLLPMILLLFAGWGGLALFLNLSLPTLWPRWGLYVLIILACTGTALPFMYLFHATFSTYTSSLGGVVVRESVSVGVYVAILAWLSIGRVLNFQIAVWLGVGFVVIEYLLRLLETSNKSENVPPQSSIR
jgi:hypothetical protein